MTPPDAAPPSPPSVPAFSREAPVPVAAVAEVLARSRLGCAAPVGAVAILGFGFVAATSNVMPVGSSSAVAFSVAVVGGAFSWVFVPWLMKRVRANARLRDLGLSAAQIRAVRRVAGPIVGRSGGMHGDLTENEIAAALRDADEKKADGRAR